MNNQEMVAALVRTVHQIVSTMNATGVNTWATYLDSEPGDISFAACRTPLDPKTMLITMAGGRVWETTDARVQEELRQDEAYVGFRRIVTSMPGDVSVSTFVLELG